MVSRVMEHFGHIDILVNNARAIIGKDKVPVTELPEEVWHHFIAINTTAVFLCTKMVGREMVRLGNGGRIISIASRSGKTGSALGAAYCASKFAVVGLTQSCALDLAPHGITVNAVCPGSINSGRLSYLERDRAEESGITTEEIRARALEESAKSIPLGRVAESEDIANMVAFLASEEARHVTGQAYNVNGGELFH
jgi:NAD(P)-dependent dehydrogenase (short-subunit alcohol dehydrogenase family)